MTRRIPERQADDIRINVNEAYELQYCSEKFGVSPQELRCAVEAAGTIGADVQRQLGN